MDARKRALAEQVLTASGHGPRMSALNQLRPRRQSLTERLRAALPEGFSEQAIAAAVESELLATADAIFDENIRIYSTHFTEAHLLDMLAFYRSPGGKALVAKTPTIIEEKAALGRKIGTTSLDRMIEWARRVRPIRS